MKPVQRREFHGPKDYLDAAKDPKATAEELHNLAGSSYVFVRIAVAANEATSSPIFRHLMEEADFETLYGAELMLAIASNPSAPADVLALVCRQVPELLHVRNRPNGFAAGVELARREDTPLDALAALLADTRTTREFRKVVARDTTRSAVRDILAADRSERVRNAAHRNTSM